MSKKLSSPIFLVPLFPFLLFLNAVATAAAGDSSTAAAAAADKEVLLDLKRFLLRDNRVNRGPYAGWNESEASSCRWPGVACASDGHVAGIDLRNSGIVGGIFPNFSLLHSLTRIDLSSNAINGPVPPDLNQCRALRHLNLSHNLIAGELNLTALALLDILDVSVNRFVGQISSSFPANCGNLVSLNISSNNFTGDIGDYLDGCRRQLQFLDLSLNHFGGQIFKGFWWLRQFSASDNHFMGEIASDTFPANCSLETLDISGNRLSGNLPGSIANCSRLTVLDLWGNFFTGRIPSGIGSLTELTTLFLGNNSFDKDLPVELIDCKKLVFLDLSRNKFQGEIQRIIGNFTTLKILIMHSNSFTGGIEESGVLKLQNILRLDLSFNNFSRELPAAVADMPELKYLILAHNKFYGNIPPEYGRIKTLQALDLSFNVLGGRIPPEIGNLTSLLWLMLSNNQLTGGIPPEIGSCRSLLWLNLANNSLSGRIPQEISRIGRDPSLTFENNRRQDYVSPGSGECLAMLRWLPVTYPPFSFVYTVLTRRACRATWNQLLKGYGVFPVCLNSSNAIRTLDSSGYIQLSDNLLSGEVPSVIGLMRRISILNIENNNLSGELPPAIARPPLLSLNVSGNRFFGLIPSELGGIQCLQILDLSRNNFSGELPASLNGLSDLNKFNASFNPLLHGVIPLNGQIATFDNNSFIGDPLITFSTSASPRGVAPPSGGSGAATGRRSTAKMVSFWFFVSLTSVIFLLGMVSFMVCITNRSPVDAVSVSEPDSFFLEPESFLFNEAKRWSDSASPLHSASDTASHPSRSPSGVKVFQLDKTAFTYYDIVSATGNFSPDKVIGRGGSGVVYRGMLPDGRQVAVKKLQRGGKEGERAFRAEMEVVAGGHPNLVALFGWCLSREEKILVYEYMEGGNLEDVIKDRQGFGWQRRAAAAVEVARGLMYLHDECVPAVVHRDVKASNVMMDEGGAAKVTDLGLARVVLNGETHVSTMVAGTVGYVAPEYGQTWRATTKGDVYSFGVLIMELATTRRAVEDGGEECLVEWARRVGMEEAAAAAAVEGWGEDGGEVMRGLLRVGMRCTEEVPQARPDMREVLAMLLKVTTGSGGGDAEGGCPVDPSD